MRALKLVGCKRGWWYMMRVNAEVRMDAAATALAKREVEKLLYAALLSADITRDWPNCSWV